MAKGNKAADGAKNAVSDRRKRLQDRIETAKKAMTGKKGVIAMIAFALIGLAFYLDHSAGTGLLTMAGTSYALLYASPDGSVKSGRAGSVVYMRNGRRRNFVVPALVQNDFTQAVRARLGINSNSWSGLTDAERTSFNNAVGFTYVNRFGETKILKGKALFVRLNQNLVNAGAAPITTCPLPIDVVGVTALGLDVDVTPLSENYAVTFDTTPVAADTQIMVMATMPLPAGYSRPSASKYRLITQFPPTTTSPQNVVGDYTSKFGAVPEGAKVFVKVYVISTITGQASPANIASSIAHT